MPNENDITNEIISGIKTANLDINAVFGRNTWTDFQQNTKNTEDYKEKNQKEIVDLPKIEVLE